MDTTRYVLGVLFVVSVPLGILFWYPIHAFPRFWRRAGMTVTYSVMGVFCVALGFFAYGLRGVLLGPDLGTNWILWIPGGALYVTSAWVNRMSFRKLPVKTFLGVPELTGSRGPEVLLQDGAYGVVRHPRYLSVLLGIAGFSLFVNYLGVYLMVLGSLPGMAILIFLEERELGARFGPAYDEYRARVPALIPRFSRTKTDEEGLGRTDA